MCEPSNTAGPSRPRHSRVDHALCDGIGSWRLARFQAALEPECPGCHGEQLVDRLSLTAAVVSSLTYFLETSLLAVPLKENGTGEYHRTIKAA